MIKQKATYNWKLMLAGALIWEVLFWLVTLVLFALLGYFEPNSTAEGFAFKNPRSLYLLLAVFPLLWVYFYSIWKSNKLSGNFPVHLSNVILQPVSSFNSFLRFFFFRNALIFMVFSIAQPGFGTKKVKATMDSLELIVCLDISNSMNTKDIERESSRLDIAKRALNQLVNNLHGEKLGIAVFAGGAYVQLPITGDYGAAKMFINEIETGMISNQGTNIAQALKIANAMFTPAHTTKAIMLVTDGENHEEDPGNILEELQQKNIQLCVLGIGTPNGGPIPINPKRPELGYKSDANGKTIVSRVNPDFIRKIAAKAKGFAAVSSDPYPDLSGLLTEINQMKRTLVEEFEFDVKENRYQIPLFVSMLFWVLYLLWSKEIFAFEKPKRS